MISRRKLLTASLGAAGVTATTAGAAGTPTRTLTAADIQRSDFPTVEAMRLIDKGLKAQTGDRLGMRIYHSGQLGREVDALDLTTFGVLDLSRINMATINNAIPHSLILSLPYVFDSIEHMHRVQDSAIGEEILKAFESRHIIGLCFYDSGSRSIYNNQRALHAPKDLKGLNIRAPQSDVFLHMLRAMGANPIPLPFGEVFSGLQTGLMDGAENNIVSFESSRQFEEAPYWADTMHSFSPEALVMSKRNWDKLSKADQVLLKEQARLSVAPMRQMWRAAEIEAEATVRKSGVKFNTVDMAAFKASTQPLLERYIKTHKLEDLYRRVRDLA